MVHAHLEVPLVPGVRSIEAPTAKDMLEVMLAEQPAHDIVIMAAAVADWQPDEPSREKFTKQGKTFTPLFVQTRDVLQELGKKKPKGQILVGFAAETHSDPAAREARAREKRKAKKIDAIVLNQVGDQVGFGEVETTVTLITASPQLLTFEGTKSSVAGRLLDALPKN
jgi:phosphopantothenoylcysteine decarboxylase/phosphopantothenate--cysteine ligase